MSALELKISTHSGSSPSGANIISFIATEFNLFPTIKFTEAKLFSVSSSSAKTSLALKKYSPDFNFIKGKYFTMESFFKRLKLKPSFKNILFESERIKLQFKLPATP